MTGPATSTAAAPTRVRRTLLVRVACALAAIAALLGALELIDDGGSDAPAPPPASAAAPPAVPAQDGVMSVAVQVAPPAADAAGGADAAGQSDRGDTPADAAVRDAATLPVPETAAAPTHGSQVAEASAEAKVTESNAAEATSDLPQQPAPPPPAPPGKGYLVQLGVFAATANAEILRTELAAQGYSTHLQSRVVLGPFPDRSAAKAAGEKLRAERGLDGLIIPPRKP